MIWLWVGFLAFVLLMLALDLGVFNKTPHAITTKEALRWVCIFVAMGAMFNVAVYFIYQNNWLGFGQNFVEQIRLEQAAKLKVPADQLAAWTAPKGNPAAEAASAPGRTAAIQFLTGWLTEYSLSVDNIFVIALIFAHFAVQPKYQHRVLFWGILGALILRGIMIGAGVELVKAFEWVLYIFGAFLIYTAFKIARGGGDDAHDFENSLLVRLARKVLPISPSYDADRFFTRLPDGRRAMTPMFLVLLIVEATDVVFAVDSIPAIIGITRDPFLVFTSNVFAILGLRSLYFALAAMMGKFHFLKYSLAVVLGFVGIKMLMEMPVINIHVKSWISLSVIVLALAAGVVASLLYAKKHPQIESPPPSTPVGDH